MALRDFIYDGVNKFTKEEFSTALKVAKYFASLESREDFRNINFSSWGVFKMYSQGLQILIGEVKIEDLAHEDG